MQLATFILAAELATFGGQSLDEAFFRRAVASAGPQAAMLTADHAALRNFLQRIIAIKMLAQEATTAGLDKEPEVQERLAAAREKILAEVFVRKRTAEKMTEPALKEFFLSHKEIFSREAYVLHAVFPSAAKANEVMEAALKPGVDFAALIKPFRVPDHPELGGELNFVHRGKMPETFMDAVFATEAGTVHRGIVKTDFGYHVLKVLEFRTNEAIGLSDSRQVVEETFQTEVQDKLMQELSSKQKLKVDEKAFDALTWSAKP